MSVSTDGIVAYGYPLPDEELEYEGGLYGITPVQLITHCSDGYPMYFVAIASSYISASRGYPKKLETFRMERDTTWDQMITAFAKEHYLPEPEPLQIGWHLMSYWG